MDKDILNSLKLGEKVADIQEHYWGQNGEKLVYKVTIYTCKSLLFGKYISKYEYPFYFKTKEFAEEFIQVHDKYKFDEFYRTDYADHTYTHYKICPKNISFRNAKCEYVLVVSTFADHNVTYLTPGSIWDGYIECRNKRHKSNFNYKKYYTEIDKLENDAAKENTSGKTYSYKLTEV